jgi:hypothetical protein
MQKLQNCIYLLTLGRGWKWLGLAGYIQAIAWKLSGTQNNSGRYDEDKNFYPGGNPILAMHIMILSTGWTFPADMYCNIANNRNKFTRALSVIVDMLRINKII